MKIKVINKNSDIALPSYQTNYSSGLDIRSNQDCVLKPDEIKVITTGIFIEIPKHSDFLVEAQIRSRSGLSKDGLIILNAPGTIDNDYNGEIKLIVMNCSNYVQKIIKGSRLAQMVFCKVERIEWEEVSSFETDVQNKRNDNGFGSTGIQ